MLKRLAEPCDSAAHHQAALARRSYALTPGQAIAIAKRRQIKLVLRDKVLLRGRLLQARTANSL